MHYRIRSFQTMMMILERFQALWIALVHFIVPIIGASNPSENELWSDRCNIERRLLSAILHHDFQLPDIPVVYNNDISNRNDFDEVFISKLYFVWLNFNFSPSLRCKL